MARTRAKRTTCPNCGNTLAAEDNFCGRCGQENHTHKLPVRHFLVELLSGLFNFDTKLLRTLRDLFWPPGLVIREFNANKRARYVHPLRLYLFTSLIFFLMLAWTTSRLGNGDMDNVQVNVIDKKASADDGLVLNFGEGQDLNDSTLQELNSRAVLTDGAIDSTLNANGISAGFWQRIVVRIVMNLSVSADANTKAAYIQNLLSAFSKVMFLLLPLFASLLYLLHFRSGLFFTEHLVFALYFHSVVFMLIAIQMVIGSSFESLSNVQAPFVLSLVHLVWSMHTAYQRSWAKTVLKALMLISLYMVLLLIGFAAAAVIGVL